MIIRKTGRAAKKLSFTSQKSHLSLPSSSDQARNLEVASFPVVGIGISITGFETLRQLLAQIPADSGAAFVVIFQSTDSTQVSQFSGQLRDVTGMEIVLVEDLSKMQPDCIYMATRLDRNLFISNGFLCAFDTVPESVSNFPIDFFFRSLAEDRRESAVGVILSSVGGDGAQGLLEIKKKGGLSLAQDCLLTEFEDLGSVFDTTAVGTRATLKLLPDIIARYLKSNSEKPQAMAVINDIVQLLHARTGNDFSRYKRSTLHRRIDRRMQQNQMSTLKDYVHFLNENPKELDLLFKELLINVTHFFRDPVMWQYVKAEIIPPILAANPQGKTVRVWVPACSTGEEAYGFAILFQEALEQSGLQDRYAVKIFATDLDQEAIIKARRGLYPMSISQYISLERLSRFFIRQGNGYRVCNAIRETVVFAPQNVLADVPFSKLDILSCRNLLIYLDRELQKRLLPLFYYALNPGGILLLGTAESIDNFSELFTPLERSLAIYKRLDNGLQLENRNLMQDFSLSAITKKNPVMNLEEILQLLRMEQAMDLPERTDDAAVTAMMTELQLMREEMQTTQEEMQTSQEELRSSNEELHSTNEELLAANRELQAANKALIASKANLKLLYRELQTTYAELTTYLEAIGQLALVSVSDRSGRIIEANDRFCEISGYNRQELIGQDHRILNSGVHSKNFFIEMWETIINGRIWHKEICNRRKSGSLYWVDSTIVPFKDSNGRIIRYISVRVDITARKQKELILRERLKERTCLYAIRREMEQDCSIGELSARIFEHLIPAMQFPDHVACMISIHDQRYTSYNYNEDLNHGIFARIKINGTVCGQLQVFYTEEKSFMLPDEQNLIDHIADDFRFWLERKQLERHISFMANHDALTGLPNRLLLQDRLSQALAHNQRHRDFSAVLFIDLDHFKVVNDTLGHGFGDLLLKEVAARLLSSIRSEDTAARQGGDEFIVILTQITDVAAVESIVKKILYGLAQPYHINERVLHIDSSIGIALYPKDGKDVDALLKHSDLAMYHAKATGRSNYQFYSAEMNRLMQEKHELGNDLHKAIRNNELMLYFQPIIDMDTHHWVGLEVLLRWQHAEKGLISPAQFIKLAEETGLILPIGDWVIRTTCMQLKEWQDEGLEVPRIAINLSVKQFQKKYFVQEVASILKQVEVSASCLALEITESMLAENIAEVNGTLQQLSAMGFKISIDDFGTGYSNLSYLKHYTIDALKIDRSFVRDIAIDENDAAIVTAIIAMAHSLNMHVVAEGVESKEQIDFLKQRGCRQYQGFYFSKPLPARETAEKLKQWNTILMLANVQK